MPIWFQIDRSRVRISEYRFVRMSFWHIAAVKIKFFLFSAFELPIHKLYFLGKRHSLAKGRQTPCGVCECLFLVLQAHGLCVCDVTLVCSGLTCLLWQLEEPRTAALFTKMHKITHVSLAVKLLRVWFWPQRFWMRAKQLEIIMHFREKHVMLVC